MRALVARFPASSGMITFISVRVVYPLSVAMDGCLGKKLEIPNAHAGVDKLRYL
jgi:hypothetical protein